jgi:hypothetical protein
MKTQKRDLPGEIQLGFALLSDHFAQMRNELGLSLTQVAALSKVPVESIKRFEAHDPSAITLSDLFAIGRTVGCRPAVRFFDVPPRKRLTNRKVLLELERLIGTGKYRHFVKNQPDRDHPQIRWDIIGDRLRNRLFVVARNRKSKVRFAKMTCEPGGWSIEGQLFGMDAETNSIARALSEELFEQYRAQLLRNKGRVSKSTARTSG